MDMYSEIRSRPMFLLVCVSLVISCAVSQMVVVAEDGSFDANASKDVDRLPSTQSYVEELEQLKKELERQKLEIASVRTELSAAVRSAETAGTSYTRWGRKTCTGDAETVYTGHAAGAHNALNGSGSNLLCLHATPQWQSSGSHRGFSPIYGVEVELYYHNRIFSYENNGGRSVSDQPGSCAVCYAQRRHVTLMIPARTECPPGWTLEYSGYVLADGNFYRRRRTSFVCWDRAPQSAAAGGVNQNQAVLYPVEIKCGTLPCNTFVDGSELACVVCSK